MNIDFLTVYKPIDEKIRLGKNNDGGYVMMNLDTKYDLFISCGVSDDVSFENAVLERYSCLSKCLAFDGTIDKIPADANQKIEFIKKNIGGTNTNEVSNLHQEIVNYSNILLKCDIEGSEYELFALLNEQQMMSFKQIVIEIHYPFANESTWSILGKLQQTHYLCHLHVNNHCGTTTFNTTDGKLLIVPNVFEAAYIRKEQVLERSNAPIPDPNLDQPNVLDKEEISLTGWPYTL